MAMAAAVIFVGCQTGGGVKLGEVKVPAVLDPLFILCVPGDGATTLQVFDSGQLLGSGEAEWLAKVPGEWDVEVSNAVGQTMLKLQRRPGGVKAEGKLAAKVPQLGVDPKGYLVVDGHQIGLKADEIPCLLNFGLPRGWMNQTTGLSVSDRRTVVDFADPVRTMTVTATDLGVRSKEKVCTDLSWRTFLWFHDTLTWCQAPSGKREATLTGVGDYSLKWVKLDDQ
jgi:hypothetical protein